MKNLISFLMISSSFLIFASCSTPAQYQPMDPHKQTDVSTKDSTETKTLESYFSTDKLTEIQVLEAGGKGTSPEISAIIKNHRKTIMILDLKTAYQDVDWKQNPAPALSTWYDGCKSKDPKAEVLECAKSKVTLAPGRSKKVIWRFKTGLREFVLPLGTAKKPDEIRIKFKVCVPMGPCETESNKTVEVKPETTPTVKK